MENCQTIKISNNSLKDNNTLQYNFNSQKIILNNNNKKKLDSSYESIYDHKFNTIEVIKRKKLDNIKTDKIISFNLKNNSSNLNNINKINKENNPPSNILNKNSEIKLSENINNHSQEINNTNMSTSPDIANIESNTENVTVDTINIASDTSSVLPTPPQTPKANNCILLNESNAKVEQKNENEGENINKNNKESLKEDKPIVKFDYINVSVHDEINGIKSNTIDDSSDEDDDDNEDEDSNEEYEDINIGDEFNEINNPNDITSATNLLSVSNETISTSNSISTPVSSSEITSIPLNNSIFSNSNGISYGNTIDNDSTLNSGDSTLIQYSSVSSYIDKEDEEMSESSIYLKKFSIYTASASQPKNPRPVGTLPPICKEDCGEDAYFILDQPNFSALGIADGVGGWTFLGYDPSLFAWDLMNCCKECATTNTWPDPQDILVGGYNKVVEKNEIEAGSSTACIITLDKTTGTVYSSNIGDSGFIVIRDGKVAYQTHELQHYFNAPYQLSVLPDEMKNDPINIMDSPNDAIIDQCTVEKGDVIVLGTDGLWDNIFNEEIITKLASSIEKIDDIQSQIKQINEEFYQLKQKQQQKGFSELDENTELIELNKIEKLNKDQNEQNDNIQENENETNKNETNENEIKEEKEIKETENKIKKEKEIKETENKIKKEMKINNDEIKEKNKYDDQNNNEVKTEQNDDKETENNINNENEISPHQNLNKFIKRKEELNNECNKILKEIAVKLTSDTREMSRNFDKVSPFSYNAKKCGIIHYGGYILINIIYNISFNQKKKKKKYIYIYIFIYLFIYLFIHSFIHSFIYLFIQIIIINIIYYKIIYIYIYIYIYLITLFLEKLMILLLLLPM